MTHRILASFLAVVFIFMSLVDTAAAFTDTRYSWYASSIAELESLGSTNGFGDGTYRPASLITRAEFLKILLKSAGTPVDASPAEPCFGDVPVTDWAHAYVCAARDLGIAHGYEDGNFAPKANVTVLEAITMGFRAFGIVPPALADGPWYDAYRTFASANGIVESHSYLPDTAITRWRAADVISRSRAYAAARKPLGSGSAGCLQGAPLGAKNTIEIGGTNRSYNLYVPSDYDAGKQYGLIVAFHGRTSSNDAVQGYMGLQWSRGYGRRGSGAASQNDFIVAYPAGLSVKGGYAWGSSSVEFFDAILSQVSTNYCIDRDRVFVVGHSLGAGFANEIACRRGELLRGASAIAGVGYAKDCTGPVAELFWHNAGDPLVSYVSGKDAEWARKKLNSCSLDSARDVTVGQYQCKEWNDCARGTPVVWCEGYQTSSNDLHGWPKSGGSAIISFFKTF